MPLAHGFGPQPNSGVYCFRPKDEMYEPIDYSAAQLSSSEASYDKKGIHTFSFDFWRELDNKYANGGPSNEDKFMRARIHISVDQDLKALKMRVDLQGLPTPSYSDGNEVVVQWHLDGLKNQQTFYTDSNGLEMQKRVLNQRKAFKVTDYYSQQNVTSNYYPITSAISIRDPKTGVAMTVMNDKTQGGSSLREGTIELMQNRITPADDNKGQDDRLIEKDQYGNTIRVRSTYYVQIFDYKKPQNFDM